MAKDPSECCNSILIARVTPVLFILAIVAWSDYAYVVHMCIVTVTNIPEKVVYMVFYHILLFLMLWCFFAVIFTKTSSVPPQFYLTESELRCYETETSEAGQKALLQEKVKTLPIHCRTATGDIRFCDLCKAVKPDRAHHCSTCGKCILKMDHHCVWVNNCICFSNYKFFVLLIGYSCLYCAFIAGTSVQYCIKFWMDTSRGIAHIADLNTLFLFFISLVVAGSLAALFAYHIHLIWFNRSTMEHSFITPTFVNGPDKYGFNHGTCANFVDVFGEMKLLWCLPVFTGCGDGVTFARNLLSDSMNKYRSMEASRVHLETFPSIKTRPELVQPLSPKHFNTSDTSGLLTNEVLPASDSQGVIQVVPVTQEKWM